MPSPQRSLIMTLILLAPVLAAAGFTFTCQYGRPSAGENPPPGVEV